MTFKYYYLDDKKRPQECEDIEEFINKNENSNNSLKQTHLDNGIFISTVFLSFPSTTCKKCNCPMVFETMVFRNYPTECEVHRFCTYEHAISNHDDMVKKYENE